MCIIPDRNFMKPKLKHETKEYHKDVLKKANDFLESYEDPFKSVTITKTLMESMSVTLISPK